MNNVSVCLGDVFRRDLLFFREREDLRVDHVFSKEAELTAKDLAHALEGDVRLPFFHLFQFIIYP